MAELVHELEKRRQETDRLLEHGWELHSHLSSLCAVSKNLRMRSRRAIEGPDESGGTDSVSSQYADIVFGSP
jgi:hypothetical protein